MKLARTSKAGLLLAGFGLFICIAYTIRLKGIKANVAEIHMPMALEAHNSSYYPLGFLLCLIGAILFFVPFLKAKSK